MSSGGVFMDDVFLAGPVEEFDRLGVRRLGFRPSGRANFSQRGAQLAPLSAVRGSPGAGLAHAFGGGPDSWHGNLSE